MAATAAVGRIGEDIRAVVVAEVLWLALATAVSALEENTHCRLAPSIGSRRAVRHPVAILILAVTILVGARMEILVAVIAVRTAADRWRISVMVLVEDVEQADGRGRVAAYVGLAGVALEGLLAVGVVGASRRGDTTLVNRTVLPTRTRRRARVRTDGMGALTHRATGVDRTIEAVVAVRGACRTGISGRAPSCSGGTCVGAATPITRRRGITASAAQQKYGRDGDARKQSNTHVSYLLNVWLSFLLSHHYTLHTERSHHLAIQCPLNTASNTTKRSDTSGTILLSASQKS